MLLRIVSLIVVLFAASGCVPSKSETRIQVANDNSTEPAPTSSEKNCRNQPIDERELESVLSNSNGVALLKIEQLIKHDATPYDGPLTLRVTSEIVESHGYVTKEFEIYLKSAGNGPPDAVESEPIVDPKEIAVGQKYWFAFEWHSGFPHPVEAWPASSTLVAKTIHELEQLNDFAWNSTGMPDSKNDE